MKLSIVIPVYNAALYLHTCLESIFSQQTEEVEVLCVNDGSTDGSLQILEQYACTYRTMQVLSQENKGLSEARNRGVASAKGEYVFFLDSDDFLQPGTLSAFLRLQGEQPDMVLFNAIGYKGREFALYTPYPLSYTPFSKPGKEILQNDLFPYPVWNYLFKRDFLKRNQLHFKKGVAHEDVFFTVKALYHSTAVKVVPYFIPVVYRNNQDSITNRCTFRSLHDLMQNCLDLYDFLHENRFEDPEVLNKLYVLFKYAVNQSIANRYIQEFDAVFQKEYGDLMERCARTPFEKKEVARLKKGLAVYSRFRQNNECLSAFKHWIKKIINKAE